MMDVFFDNQHSSLSNNDVLSMLDFYCTEFLVDTETDVVISFEDMTELGSSYGDTECFYIDINTSLDKSEVKRTLIHELRHLSQCLDGWCSEYEVRDIEAELFAELFSRDDNIEQAMS